MFGGNKSAPATGASSSGSSADSSGRWGRWGQSAFDQSIKWSDWASGYANAASAKIGGERFWPKSNDTEEEILKCERILRSFTVDGITAKAEDQDEGKVVDNKGSKLKKQRKVLKKIPPRAIKNAKGIVIYTAMRSGIAPFGGAGGTGLVMARLPDGSWSAPASVSPNNMSVGLLLGFDIFNVILLLNTDKAVESFYTMAKVTLGAETAVAAGPIGAGASAESGVNRAPIYSYVQSRGLYAGIEAMGQAFLSRFDENERFYYWPGIKVRDILTGKVRIPPSVAPLHRALRDAESGVAQGDKLERTVYDTVKVPPSEVMDRLNAANQRERAKRKEKQSEEVDGEDADQREHEVDGEEDDDEEEMIRDGERLRLPPTPQELEALEAAGIPDEDDLVAEQREREEVYKMPPPPMHKKVSTYWSHRPTKRGLRTTKQLVMGGSAGAKLRGDPVNIPLPPSPWEVPLPPSPVPLAEKNGDDTGDSAFTILPPPLRSAQGERRDGVDGGGAQDANAPSEKSPVPLLPLPPRRKPPPPLEQQDEKVAEKQEQTSQVGDNQVDSTILLGSVDDGNAVNMSAQETTERSFPETMSALGRENTFASAGDDLDPIPLATDGKDAGNDVQHQRHTQIAQEPGVNLDSKQEGEANGDAGPSATTTTLLSRQSSLSSAKDGILPPPPRRPPRAR